MTVHLCYDGCGRHTSQRRGFAGLYICDACWRRRVKHGPR